VNGTVERQGWSRLAARVQEHYLNRPDLIESLLVRLGAHDIHHDYGHGLNCPCPIHGGTKPMNFKLWYDRGYVAWKCYSDCSGDSGDLVKLIRRKFPHASFEQAVTWLGRAAGLPINGPILNVSREMLEKETMAACDRRQKLVSDERKTKFKPFRASLVDSSVQELYKEQWRHVLHFLTGSFQERSSWGERCRAFPVSVLRDWEVGFVPAPNWTWRDPQNGKVRGWRQHRVSIPWRDSSGNCIGFSGRRIDGYPSQKYKVLYGTGRNLTLYGLHKQRTQDAITKTRCVHLVEGYTDVWRSHMHGALNTLCPGGTELAKEQIDVLAHYNLERAILFYDGDAPGQSTALRKAQQLLSITKVFIAVPPGGQDPDEILDVNQFWDCLSRARPFIPKGARR
jgi:hypothetical protein